MTTGTPLKEMSIEELQQGFHLYSRGLRINDTAAGKVIAPSFVIDELVNRLRTMQEERDMAEAKFQAAKNYAENHMVSKDDARLAVKRTMLAFVDGLENKKRPTIKELFEAWDKIIEPESDIKKET